MKFIADERILFESPNPENVFCYSPGICNGFNNRLLVCFDLGGAGVASLGGALSRAGDWGLGNQLRVMYSDDNGETWLESKTTLPMYHSVMFKSGNALYIIGVDDRLLISRSDDNGETWSEVAVLDEKYRWAHMGNRVNLYKNVITVVAECVPLGKDWSLSAPVMMRAAADADLTELGSWKFSEPFILQPHIYDAPALGVPCYPLGELDPGKPDPRINNGEGAIESNVWRVLDPTHRWYDPRMKNVVITMRANVCLTNLAVVMMGVEKDDGTLEIQNITTPAGTKHFYIPFPGGQIRFDMVYDEVTKMFFMVSCQSTDSMTKIECLPPDRFNLPFSERRRLQLHFSKNGVDWCFAGMVSIGPGTEKASRQYAVLEIHNDDIFIFSRSGDERAVDPHNGNLLTLHKVKNFRNLIY